jgi:hypothetical protein
VLRFIVTAILAFFIFRLIGSLFGLFGRGRSRRPEFDRSRSKGGVDRPDYKDLTPYDIEDAEYEELPKQD